MGGERCTNHPEREAGALCHGCKRYFCFECLMFGPENPYCLSPGCLGLLAEEMKHKETPESPVEVQEQELPGHSGEPRYPEGCPVTEGEKEWIEESFLWLVDQFGTETLTSATPVLPTRDFFPGRYDCSKEAIQRLLGIVCEHMRIDESRLELMLSAPVDDNLKPLHAASGRGAAGSFLIAGSGGKIGIRLHLLLIKDLETMVAVIAHELGHVHLLADKRLKGDEEYQEHLTDLLTVFFGLGIFTANAAFRFSQWQRGTSYGWETGTLGYLSQQMYGYALAGFSWMRGESQPDWPRYLCVDVKHYRKQASKYLYQGGYTRLPRLNTA